MKKLLHFICFVCVHRSPELIGTNRLITGTVTSAAEGEGPIPGVTVQVKGTTIGTVTDANGKYSLSVPQNATTLIFLMSV
jgi:hypothetical protein